MTISTAFVHHPKKMNRFVGIEFDGYKKYGKVTILSTPKIVPSWYGEKGCLSSVHAYCSYNGTKKVFKHISDIVRMIKKSEVEKMQKIANDCQW